MKTIIINFAALTTVLSFVLLAEFVKTLDSSDDACRYPITYEVNQHSNSASDPAYPLPAMRILQIW